LGSRPLQLKIIRDELLEVRAKYGDERRTEIVDAQGDFSMEDLIAEEDMVVTVSHGQYIKRLPVATYRRQGRGGRGVTAATMKEEDWIEQLFVASTHDIVLFFTSLGRVFSLKVHQIPEAGRTARGKSIVNLLHLMEGERVSATVRVESEFSSDRYLLFATSMGLVKRTSLDQFTNIRSTGIRAIELRDGDRLIDVRLTSKGQHAILAVRSGKAIRFSVEDARAMGRTARGVKGIELSTADDAVVRMIVVEPDDEQTKILSVTERGYGKLTPLSEYRLQGRGGKGISAMKASDRNGPVVSIHAVTDKDEIMVITRGGIVIRMGVEGISTMGRNTQGVRLINLEEGDVVSTVARILTADEIDE
jgi:DNA gyrase subunit A